MRAVLLLSAFLTPLLPGQSSPEEVREELTVGETAEEPADELVRDAATRGLEYLAKTQTASGCWTAHVGHKQDNRYLVFVTADEQDERDQGHLGVTSLAGLAFLAGGHLPGRGKFGDNVELAVDYVLRRTEESGFITDSGTRMYSHAFATLFLSQVYGMMKTHGLPTKPPIKHALDSAVNWIVDNQNAQGAWRYNPFTTHADLSVTVCQLQSLRAARNIGIRVPKDTIDRAIDYVRRSRTRGGADAGLYYYKIHGRGAFRKNTEYAINAAAVTSLVSAGVYDAELIDPPLAFLEDDYPWLAMHYRNHYFYWYGNYYASQAFFHAGADRFDRYYKRISHDLLDDQEVDGRWRNTVGPGDAFSTAVASLILFIPHQYLPIFQR